MKRDGNSQTGISETGSPERQQPRRYARWRSRRVLRRGLSVVLVLLVLYVIWLAAAAVILGRAKARVARVGDSLKPADYMPPEPPLDDNATPYLEAGAEISRGRKDEIHSFRNHLEAVFASGQSPSPEDIEFLRGQLEEFDLVLRITDEVMPRKEAWFDTKHESRAAYAVEIPNYVYRQFLANLLAARAVVAAEKGRFDDAYASAAGIFRLTNWVYRETPILIGTLNGIAIGNLGCNTVEFLVNLSRPSEESRRRILEEVGAMSIREHLSTAMKVERSFDVNILIEVPLVDTARATDWPAWMGFLLDYPLRPYLFMDTAAFLDEMTELMEQSDRPAYLQPEDYLNPDRGFPWWAILTNVLIPNLGGASSRRDQALARIDMMKMAFELEGYRDEEGGYPESLDDLGGERLIDPFSGEGYRYRKTEDGYLLWSLSANRKDDGGEEAGEVEDWKPGGDIVWTVKR